MGAWVRGWVVACVCGPMGDAEAGGLLGITKMQLEVRTA